MLVSTSRTSFWGTIPSIDSVQSPSVIKKTVADLREAIGKMIRSENASKLDLWKVEVPILQTNHKLQALQGANASTPGIREELGGEKLNPAKKVSHYFNQPFADETIHIIVVPPSGT